MSTGDHPLTTGVFVCIECGDVCLSREALDDHWRDWGHGPDVVQADAIDRARVAIEPVPDDDPA